MVENKKKFKTPFAAATTYFIKITGINNEILGNAVGYKKGKMIDAIRNGRSEGTEPKRRAIAAYFNQTYEDFLKIGQSIIDGSFNFLPPLQSSTIHAPISDLANKKIEKHQELVGGFEHQELAIEINQALLELEKIAGKDGLLEIKGVLRQMLREAEKKRAAANGTEGK